MKRLFFATLLCILAAPAFSCWFQKISYNDYLHGVNNFIRHSQAEQEVITPAGVRISKTRYTVSNNATVDFPLTVTVKLISDSPVYIDTEEKKPELLQGKLQYRVLPDGEWTTAAELAKPTGTISMSSLPDTYFGKNNICPLGLKKGDVVMVRVYVTDGAWQSGELGSMCDAVKDWTLFQQGKARTWTLPSTIGPYEIATDEDPQAASLGGSWTAHYVMTVVFSGEYRPAR